MKRKLPLYAKIILGMLVGTGFGLLAIQLSWIDLTKDFIAPFGEIFLRLLKLIAVPLIFVSLVQGIASLTDISKLSRIGLKTISLYIMSTVIAITIGLFLVNPMAPGKAFPEEVRAEMNEEFKEQVQSKQSTALETANKGPLQFLVDLVPDNIIKASSDNRKMLQVIFFAILFGIALVTLPNKTTSTVQHFISGLNEIVLKIIHFIMLFAPFGVFALMAGLIVSYADDLGGLFSALGAYSGVVILGLLMMIVVIYPLILNLFCRFNLLKFFRGILPAQLLAFSTSSSAATLPVTMNQCENKLGVSKEISSFVLPIGATINMDGTSLYQAVAAVFIAQAYGFDLTIAQQLTIVLTATLASIGSAAVPGAGIVMLVIVLESIGLPSEGIALVLAIDRPLDMLRTAVNVTGDAVIATIVAKSEGKLNLKKKNS